MKKMCGMIIFMALLLAACGQNAPTWQEQYDLGMRYLEEGSYEEAIIAFTAAIEIDPKQAPAYVGRGDAYIGSEDYDLAEQDFNKALELDPTLDLSERFRTIEDGRNAQRLALQQEALRPIVEQMDIPFTVDAITLGESGINVAKSAYLGRPYAYSNLMDDDADDTVYTCFGMNDTPIPEGYEEDEFGFIFAAPALGGGIYHIVIADPDFVCLGGLRVGGDGSTALAFFGFPEEAPIGELEWELENGAVLNYSGADSGEYSFRYQLGNCWTRVDVVDGAIHRIFLHEDG